MARTILEVKDLTKTFADFKAVDKISFKLREGEILGLLGPNGAGKTTTIHMLLGLTTLTSGKISYFGKELNDDNREFIMSRINFSSAYNKLQARITVRQNMRIYAGLYGVEDWEERVKELAELLNIEPLMHKQFWHLSSGQRTRVVLAKALMNKPKLLLMDEPTASLDPEIIDKLLGLIEKMRKKEKIAILYTSHNMAEVERICDRVMFLNNGKIVAEDTPLELTKRVGKATLKITFDGDKSVSEKFLKENKHDFDFVNKQIVEVNVSDELIPKILFALSKKGVWMTDIDIKKPGLKDVFLSIARNKK